MSSRSVILSIAAVALLAGCAAVPSEAEASAHLAEQLDAVEQLVGGEWSASALGSRECSHTLTLRGTQAGEYRFTQEPVDGDAKFELVLETWIELGYEPRELPAPATNPIRTLEATTPDGAALTFSATDGSLTLEGLGGCSAD